MKVFIVNGFPGSGKTTFEHLCCNLYKRGTVRVCSTVDLVKSIATLCGWNGEKTDKNRKFLSDLKKLLVSWNDIPFKEIQKKIDIYQAYERKWYSEDILFVDSREPEEIARFCKVFNAKSVFIDRPSSEKMEYSNESDANVKKYNYDYIIINDGTKEDLVEKVKSFLKNI